MNNLSQTQKRILIIAVIIAIAVLCYYVYGQNEADTDIVENQEMLVKREENAVEEEQEGKIVVHITGAVIKEGIVTLEENSRIADAVEAAGGLKEDADMSKINLAYILEDGIKIKIPSINDKEEEITTKSEENVETEIQSSTQSENNKTNIVNINKASQTELETLPGIGPSIALKIVNYREENGKFSSVEELKNVSGIGDSKFENIKNLICVK